MIETKICIKCGVERPLSRYERRTYTSGKSGIRNVCKDCENERRRRRYNQTDTGGKDRVKRSNQKYRTENKERYLELEREGAKRRYHENPEWRQKLLEDSKRRYQNRSDEQKQKYVEHERLRSRQPDVVKQRAENYAKNKQYFIDKLGGQCVSCGTTDNLEFDHINPLDKSFTISGYLASTNACELEKVLEEVNKCQLLCKQCHRKKTDGPDRPIINQKLRNTWDKKMNKEV